MGSRGYEESWDEAVMREAGDVKEAAGAEGRGHSALCAKLWRRT